MTATRRFVASFIAVLLMQLAWVLVIPPFGGIDEHEHAYKAAAVARGDWSATHEPVRGGWGELVRVPRSLVEAAAPQCHLLRYVSSRSCMAGASGSDGLVEVASSAARYNPSYYVVAGAVTLGLDGYAALYAMRLLTAALCAVLMAAAFAIASSCSRWLGLAVVLALTPTAVYSTAIVAPNGVEIAAAMLLWSCLLALRSNDLPRRTADRLIVLAAAASVLLMLLRTLGPLWWALIVGVGSVLLGRQRVQELWRTRALRLSSLPIAVASACAAVWDMMARTNSVPSQTTPITASDWLALPVQYASWFFQTVAAMPLRNELVPLSTYAISFGLLGTFIGVALARGSGRERLALAAVFALASGVGLSVTIVALPHVGFLWQGRYFLPLTVGALFVAGGVFDRIAIPRLLAGPLTFAAATGGVAATQVISLLHVLGLESGSPLSGTGHWLQPTPWLVILLVAGAAILLYVATHGTRTRSRSAPDVAFEQQPQRLSS